jgi:hypothetical protein
MQVTQTRVADKIEFTTVVNGYTLVVAELFDGHEDFIVDEMGFIMTLKIAGELPQNFSVVMPLTAIEARLIDAMPVPSANA